MSGSNRKFQREAMKLKYRRFCEAWGNEQRYQKYVLASGQELPKEQPLLGRKPTFKMWLQAMQNKKIAEDGVTAPPTEPEVSKQVEVQDTDWE